jgi:7,8-didemethyl-8-hydroxy-5-deazariboflavin synthase CofG subunit
MEAANNLGNREQQEIEINVLSEDKGNVITFSNTLQVNLVRACVQQCNYCSFRRKELVEVPYSTIKISKESRLTGVREVMYTANSRPDQHSEIRAKLDLWGFSSYLDYLYTVCELGFLEGLVPVINLGFLTPVELQQLSEVSALIRIAMDSSSDLIHEATLKWDPQRRFDRRLKNLEWSSKLGIATSVSYTITKGITKGHQKVMLEKIANMHSQYGLVHEVILDNYESPKHVKSVPFSQPSEDEMMSAFNLAKSILPSDIPIIVPAAKNNIATFIKEGVRDLGQIIEYSNTEDSLYTPFNWDSVEKTAAELGLVLQQRFPLRKQFIKEEKYSSKLGQVFDSYKYKIKKDIQEKAKESKAV